MAQVLSKDQLRAWAERFNQPASQVILELRTSLAVLVRPFLEGPLTKEEWMQPLGVTCYGLDLGDGAQVFRERGELPDDVRWGIEALAEIRIIERHLDDDGNRDFLFKKALRLGQICQRINTLPLVADANRGRKVLESAVAGGKLNRAFDEKTETLLVQKVQELVEDGTKKTTAAKQVAIENGNEAQWRTILRAYDSVTDTALSQ